MSSLNITRVKLVKGCRGNDFRLVAEDEDDVEKFPEKISDLLEQYCFGIRVGLLSQCLSVCGYQGMYDWQKEFLRQSCHGAVPRNWIVTMPTGSGKSFPTNVLMLRTFFVRKRDVVFVVPYVSLAEDEVAELNAHAQYGDFIVEAYIGGKGPIPPTKRPSTRTAFVCTIEKFHILVQSLCMSHRLHTIGLIVVDEVHMLGEVDRGPTLETALMQIVQFNRLRVVPPLGNQVHQAIQVPDSSSCEELGHTSAAPDKCSNQEDEVIQVLGLSATISNVADVSKFLEACHFSGDFRPVDLTEFVVEGKKVYEVVKSGGAAASGGVKFQLKSHRLLTLYKHPDADPLTILVSETVMNGQSCLVFCSTRSRAVNKACDLTAKLAELQRSVRHADPAAREMEGKRSALRHLLQQEEEAPDGSPVGMWRVVESGVVFHHAGLSSGQRRLIEDAFRLRTINVICCTSTLSAGVNLPAEKVFVADLMIGKDPLQVSRYRQMAGRAGRAGLSSSGRCFLFADDKNSKESILQMFFESVLDPVVSHLSMNSMQRLVLMKLSRDDSTTNCALVQHVDLSLCAVQCHQPYAFEKSPHVLLQQCLDSLIESGLVVVSPDSVLKLTSKGQIAVRAIVSPHILPSEVAVQVVKDLEDAGQSLILGGTDLHLIFLCVLRKGMLKLNNAFAFPYGFFSSMVRKLSNAEEKVVSYLVGCETQMTLERFLAVAERNPPAKGSDRHQFMTRLLIAMLLSCVMDKKASLYQCAEVLSMPHSQVVAMLELVCANGLALSRICAEFPRCWGLQMLLSAVSKRLSACNQSSEVGSLSCLVGIGPHRARQLRKAGLKSPVDVASANPEALVRALGGGVVTVESVQRIIVSAQEWIKLAANDALDRIKEVAQL